MMLFGGLALAMEASWENLEKMYTFAGECFGRAARMLRRLEGKEASANSLSV
jgi:hypothetical protein